MSFCCVQQSRTALHFTPAPHPHPHPPFTLIQFLWQQRAEGARVQEVRWELAACWQSRCLGHNIGSFSSGKQQVIPKDRRSLLHTRMPQDSNHTCVDLLPELFTVISVRNVISLASERSGVWTVCRVHKASNLEPKVHSIVCLCVWAAPGSALTDETSWPTDREH